MVLTAPSPARLFLTFFTILLGFVPSAVVSLAADMTFFFEKPPPITERWLGGAYWIFADGAITSTSGDDFERFLKANQIPRESHLALNSPGGNVYGAMALGRIIRNWKLTVDIGERSGTATPYKHSDVKAGYCYSACTIAYLGGYFRFDGSSSRYGVHRFSSRGFEGNEEYAQVVSSAIAGYIVEMGVDVKLLELSSAVSKNELRILTKSELLNLNIVNNGILPVTWSYNNSGDVLYLKGERDTQYGIQKFMFNCEKRRKELFTVVMFEAKQRERDIARHQAEQLRLDNRIFNIKTFRINRDLDSHSKCNAV